MKTKENTQVKEQTLQMEYLSYNASRIVRLINNIKHKEKQQECAEMLDALADLISNYDSKISLVSSDEYRTKAGDKEFKLFCSASKIYTLRLIQLLSNF